MHETRLRHAIENIKTERGSEITEQIFWIGLIILAVLFLLPQLRNILLSNLQGLIDVLGV